MVRLKVREFRLFAQAACALIGAHFQVRFRSMEQMQLWFNGQPNRACPRPELELAFRRASSRIRGTCLINALAFGRLLSVHGHLSELRIGVARVQGTFKAHAWLVDANEVVICQGGDLSDFKVLTTWKSSEVTRSGHSP